jgi:hypothetical protein
MRIRWSTAVALAIVGLAATLSFSATAQEVKGQVKVGIHKVKLEKDKPYEIVVDSNPAVVVNVDFNQGNLSRAYKDFKEKLYFMPAKDGEYTFTVHPPFGPVKDGTTDYTLKFKALTFADKPLAEDKYKLTDKDPKYTPPAGSFATKDTYYKAYKVEFKAGQLQYIELVPAQETMPAVIYLEGPDGKITWQENLNFNTHMIRAFFLPQKDGEYRLIATTFAPGSTGEYALAVKTVKE